MTGPDSGHLKQIHVADTAGPVSYITCLTGYFLWKIFVLMSGQNS